MKPDTRGATRPPGDAVVRAHLRDPDDTSHVIHRYPPEDGFEELLRGAWVPVWSVPAGREAPQRVLQHPVALLVVSSTYARFYGVVRGVATTTLTGRGWAVGVLCAPAAGSLVCGGSMAAFTDRHVPLVDVLGRPGEELVDAVRSAVDPDPGCERGHREAVGAFHDALRPLLPVDAEGELVNRVVGFVEARGDVTRVSQVCEAFGLSERALQRLVNHRLGLTPKWLIQRRRLHEAVQRLRARETTLAEVAADLGYADQSHFARDFTRVTSTTPGAFAADQAR